jgi:glucoamylase
MKAGAAKYLYSEKLGRFARRLVPLDMAKPPDAPTYDEPSPLLHDARLEDIYEVDEVLDASLYAIYKFHLFEADDPRVEKTMRAVEQKLWCKTDVGGVARYENDYYHRISNDIAKVPGNPWFICTLWLADYYITRAKTTAQLKDALPILEWTAAHALESGVLAEQVNPYTNEPISVSPLTWSHATVVSTSIKYLEKLEELQTCNTCSQPLFKMRKRGAVEVKSQGQFNRLDANFESEGSSRETASTVGHFIAEGETGNRYRATLSIDVRDCIGCDVCVAHCDKGVLRMVDNKAMVDLRNLNQCDLDGECVSVCPTSVVSLEVLPLDEPALTPAEAAELDDEAAPLKCNHSHNGEETRECA